MLSERGLEAKNSQRDPARDEAEIVRAGGASRGGSRSRTEHGRPRHGHQTRRHGVAALGGLHVIATERHESGRVDRQLFGRAARQGDPGERAGVRDAEDELVRRICRQRRRRKLVYQRVCGANLRGKDRIGAGYLQAGASGKAQ